MEARWWRDAGQGKVLCELCPRFCVLPEGKAGYCGVRFNQGGRLQTAVHGLTSGFCVDPVEKKPLYHFLPGTSVLSFGTVGCNLGCIFCQNWTLSDRAILEGLRPASVEDVVDAALAEGCSGVAFTYNEPAISAEFCIDVAKACRKKGLRTLAVTSGYISGRAREDFFDVMDGANVDLKGFTEDFFHSFCGARLAPVLETLEFLAERKHPWLEVTNLLIPGANDDPGQIRDLARWMFQHLGADVPLHFSAFHPDHRLRDRGATPASTLRAARIIAREEGLRFVYLGNIRDEDGSATHCSHCGEVVIRREGFHIRNLRIKEGACACCGERIPGVFERTPLSL